MMTDSTHVPMFSVVIATYKRPQLLPRAVQSVLNQTFPDFELIIVDDKSPDNTPDIVKSFDDPRIRYIRRETNGGCPAAKNTGFRQARGKYIAILDDDDEYLPDFLLHASDFLASAKSDLGVCWCGVQYVRDTPEGEKVIRNALWQPKYKSREHAYLSFIRSRQVGANCGLIFPKDNLLAVGMFDERLRKADDTDLLIRIVKNYDYGVIPRTLIKIHLHDNGRLTAYDGVMAKAYEHIIEKNIDALQKHPEIWHDIHYKTAWLYYHGGDKPKGREFMRRALQVQFFKPQTWFIWLLLDQLGELGIKTHRNLNKLLFAVARLRKQATQSV